LKILKYNASKRRVGGITINKEHQSAKSERIQERARIPLLARKKS